MKALLLNAHGMKSIPLSQLPEAAWTYVTGQAVDGDNLESVNARYKDIPWLYRGVEARVNAGTGMPWALHKGDENGVEVEEDQLPFLLDLNGLIEQLFRWRILYGAAYAWKDASVFGVAKQLRLMHPSTIKPQYDKEVGLIGFKRVLGAQELTYTVEEMYYTWKANHEAETGVGISDAQVAVRAAARAYSTDMFVSMYFKNGTIMPTFVVLPENTPPDEKNRVQDTLTRVATGIKNAFRFQAVTGDLKTVTLGQQSLKDLLMKDVKEDARQEIAAALGVPQTVLFSPAANYATALQDDVHFYEKTIKPEARAIRTTLNEQVFKPLGYYLKEHPERMEIYQRLEAEKSTSVKTLVDGEIMTRREARQHMGLPDEPAPDDPQYKEFTEEKKPQEIPPELEAANALAKQNEANGQTDADEENEFAKALGQWQAKALNRWNENRFAKALEFVSDAIPVSLVSAIKGDLEACKSKDAIKAVFESALAFESYP
jgi:HK97 family phage portal protein